MCKQVIESVNFADHIQSCSNNQIDKEETTSKKQPTKYCALCKQDIDSTEYRNHVASCSNNQIDKKEMKYCGLCKQDIDSSEYRNHVASCSNNRSSSTQLKNNSIQSSIEVNLFLFIISKEFIRKKGFERKKNKILWFMSTRY